MNWPDDEELAGIAGIKGIKALTSALCLKNIDVHAGQTAAKARGWGDAHTAIVLSD